MTDGFQRTHRLCKAREYRFALLNEIRDKFFKSPLVLDMVCYPFLSEQDYKDITYAAQHSCDYLALSFVNCANDVLEARKIIEDAGADYLHLDAMDPTVFDADWKLLENVCKNTKI